ncbi:hypothetical protein MGWOODY_Tha2130 [hydrothermal vent metagenome]|uniref:Uncharacterized protein n=1 Tax=hydrothermal vent metagenome TaxID=652676 RepID=A0A160TC36_9ZZZZ
MTQDVDYALRAGQVACTLQKNDSITGDIEHAQFSKARNVVNARIGARI